MTCICGHQLKQHEWTLEKGEKQPCPNCYCQDYCGEETLDVFFPKIGEYYQAICLYNGVVDKICPNNKDSLCSTKLQEKPTNHYHLWDGKNAWKCPCG